MQKWGEALHFSLADLTSYVCVHLGHCGVDGGWTPLPTHPQQYCGPASLVVYVSELGRELGGGLGVRNNIVTLPHLFQLN